MDVLCVVGEQSRCGVGQGVNPGEEMSVSNNITAYNVKKARFSYFEVVVSKIIFYHYFNIDLNIFVLSKKIA